MTERKAMKVQSKHFFNVRVWNISMQQFLLKMMTSQDFLSILISSNVSLLLIKIHMSCSYPSDTDRAGVSAILKEKLYRRKLKDSFMEPYI